MMDFLDTLFRYEYFGPILFGVIAVLIVIFFIILFFGKKDEQERKLEETRRLELANANAFKEEDGTMKVEVPAPETTPIIEPTLSSDVAFEPEKEINYQNPFDTLSDFGVSEDVKEVEIEEAKPIVENGVAPVLEPIETTPLSSFENHVVESSVTSALIDKPALPKEENAVLESAEEVVKETKYNFDELASSLAKEIEDLEKLAVEKQEKQSPELNIDDVKVNVTSIKDIKPTNPRPVFSSVFVEPITPVVEEKNENLLPENDVKENFALENEEKTKIEIPSFEEVKVEEKPMIDFSKLKGEVKPNFVKPNIELPKAVEMPIKKAETTEDVITNVPDFSNIEGESYTLK